MVDKNSAKLTSLNPTIVHHFNLSASNILHGISPLLRVQRTQASSYYSSPASPYPTFYNNENPLTFVSELHQQTFALDIVLVALKSFMTVCTRCFFPFMFKKGFHALNFFEEIWIHMHLPYLGKMSLKFMDFPPELLQQNFQNSETDKPQNKKIRIWDHISRFGVWGSIISANTCVSSNLECSAARTADAFIHIYELYNMVLLACRPNTPLSMPTQMLQYQPPCQACLLLAHPTLTAASSTRRPGAQRGGHSAHPSTISIQDNCKPGGLKASSRDCIPRTNDTGLFLFCVPS